MTSSFKWLAGVAALTIVAAPVHAGSLTIAGNGGAPAEAMKATYDKTFTEKTGIEIVQDDSNYQELPKIRAQIETGNLIWDMAVTVSVRELTMCQEGMIEQVDWAQYIDPTGFEAIGGFGECGAPYISSPGVLAYDADRYPGDTGPKTIQDFWDVEKFPGKRGLVYQPDENMELALLADGVPADKVGEVLASPGGLDRAFAKLEELRPHVHWWKSGSESMQLLMNGETVMTYTYLGRVKNANEKNNRNIKIAWSAGYVTTPIYFVILKGSPNKDKAIQYVQHVLQPEIQAAFSSLAGYGPANAKAFDHLPADTPLRDEAKYSDRGMVQTGADYLNWYMDNGDMLQQRFSTFVASN